MRLNRIIGTALVGMAWLMAAGCEQDAPPSKPSAPVVKKKIETKPEAKPSAPTPAQALKAPQAPAAQKAQPQAEPKASPEKAPAQPAGPAGETAAYQYRPGDRPDPFMPFFEEAKTAGPAPECRDVPPGPLTENEPSQFSLVAVLGQGGEAMAMVQDRSGKGYVVRPGTHLGKKCGKVSGIGAEGVTIEEPYEDLLGQKKTRKVILGFKKSEGGKR